MQLFLIFDKSTLQSFDPNDAVWLDNFFRAVITSPFLLETMADLEKENKSSRSPEEVVGSIARKIPGMNSCINVLHPKICVAELLGFEKIMLNGGPVIEGGVPISTRERKGLHYRQSSVEESIEGWRHGEFSEHDRQGARLWLQDVSGLNFEARYKNWKLFLGRNIPRAFAEAKDFAENLINDPLRKNGNFHLSLRNLGIPLGVQEKIIRRWQEQGCPNIKDFAPYTTFVFTLDLFFSVAIAADLISRARPSNRIDLAYLYYLPFCQVFVSSDWLHAEIVPLFKREDQSFVEGENLRKDLKLIDTYYSSYPHGIKEQGVIKLAQFPPRYCSFLVAELWDKHVLGWREVAEKIQLNNGAKHADELWKPRENLKQGNNTVKIDAKDVDHVIFDRWVPVRKGKWRIVPTEIEQEGSRA